MATALVTQIAYAVQTLFDPAGTAGRLVDLGKLANYGLLTSFTPAYLFTPGVNGAWYDPSDLTTLYRDAAGTLPVTAVEQPVGRMLDKSGKGNHAFNSSGNSANFPVLSARYNLLTKTEQFDDAVWTKSNATVTSNAVTSPDGTNTADALIENNANGFHQTSTTSVITSVAGTHVLSVYAKANQRNYVYLNITSGGIDNTALFDLTTGNYSGYFTGGVVASSYSSQNVGNGWWKVSITVTTTAATLAPAIGIRSTTGNFSSGYTGDGTSGIYIWGADLRVANDALNQPAYQRVNTATDYDTVGFKPYLRFNGTNQWLQTNSIDFTYGDKMFVCAGVRYFTTADQVVSELSVNRNTNNGTFVSSVGNTGKLLWASKGTVAVDITSPSAITAPITNVVSGIGNISAPSATLSVNGTQVAQSTASQGTGNYGNYPLYIGARAGSSLWFNGRLYGMVIAGKQASAAEITSTETYINQKTGAF